MQLHRQVGKKFPVAANENGVPVAMNKHPQAVEVAELNDGSEMLGDVRGAQGGYIVDACTEQLTLSVSYDPAEPVRDLFESTFEIENDPKLLVRFIGWFGTPRSSGY